MVYFEWITLHQKNIKLQKITHAIKELLNQGISQVIILDTTRHFHNHYVVKKTFVSLKYFTRCYFLATRFWYFFLFYRTFPFSNCGLLGELRYVSRIEEFNFFYLGRPRNFSGNAYFSGP